MEQYDSSKYPPFAVAADVVLMTILDGELQVLLIQRGGEPFAGAWALPGGFVEPGEDADSAARRELEEETGVVIGDQWHLEQLKTYTAPDRDPRMRVVSVAYVCLTPEAFDLSAGSDADAARWWPISKLDLDGTGGAALAFDHDTIVGDALERVRSKLEYTTIAAAFCPPRFSVRDLRRVYEAVWGVELDAGNFHRKIVAAEGFIEPTDQFEPPADGGRNARLFVRGESLELEPPFRRQVRGVR